MLSKEKDILLDTHGLIKGDKSLLNATTRKLFLKLNETGYGFEGITNKKADVHQQMNGVLIERPTIEDIIFSAIF